MLEIIKRYECNKRNNKEVMQDKLENMYLYTDGELRFRRICGFLGLKIKKFQKSQGSRMNMSSLKKGKFDQG